MHSPTRPRGLSLAMVLLATLVVAAALGALVTRLGAGHQAARREITRATDRYQAESALNLLLARIRQGEEASAAALEVARATGREVLVAGDRVLVPGASSSLQARLQPRAWRHVVLAGALDLSGVRGAFAEDDPHAPAEGAPPRASEELRATLRQEASTSGVYLAPDPAACVFRPGGGEWQRETIEGVASYRYLGGGEGESLGWRPGQRRWTHDLPDRWLSTAGDELRLEAGVWSLRGPAVLPGTLMVEGASLRIEGDLSVHGRVVVWGGSLVCSEGAVTVQAAPDALAVAVVAGSATPATTDWARDPTAQPGDLVLSRGPAHLSVGDLSRPEETGGLVLVDGRAVVRGSRLALAGVLAAGRADLDGVPAEALAWSGRIGRQPPAGLLSTDMGLSGAQNLVPR